MIVEYVHPEPCVEEGVVEVRDLHVRAQEGVDKNGVGGNTFGMDP